MSRRIIIATGLLLFPVLVMAFSMAGFACGMTIGKWPAFVALTVVAGWVGWRVQERRIAAVGWLFLNVFVSIALSGVFVLYTNADAEAYHRPAAILLANGWNPLQLTEVRQIESLMSGGFRPWHVAFLPRMGWIFGATLYKWCGFVEVADSINILMLMASVVFVHEWISGWGLQRWLGLWTVLFCISPVVASGVWGGSVDAAWYSAFLIAIVSADRKNLFALALAVLVMSSLKFTGVVIGVLIFAVYGLRMLFVCRSAFWKIVSCGAVTGILILLLNASPYLTSLKNHGGPFYPSHSFLASERFEDTKNPITYDFGLMNEDAKQIGYFGRFAWAYVSQDLVKSYYRIKTGRPDFNPEFKVSGGVGGFGPVFRVLFLLSLIAAFLVHERRIQLAMGLVLVSVLIQPTFYSGYARYVPQFYLFPLLAFVGLMLRWKGARMPAVTISCVGLGYSGALLAYPLSFFALQWIISVQNLQIAMAGRAAEEVVVRSPCLALRESWRKDYGFNVKGVEVQLCENGTDVASSYFGFGQCVFPNASCEIYDLHHQVSGNDPSIKASRNANMVRFFFKTFLPREIGRLPLRVWQVGQIRFRQVPASR